MRGCATKEEQWVLQRSMLVTLSSQRWAKEWNQTSNGSARIAWGKKS